MKPSLAENKVKIHFNSGRDQNLNKHPGTPVVLSQGLEQVLAQLVHLQSLAHSADAIKLDVAENFRI